MANRKYLLIYENVFKEGDGVAKVRVKEEYGVNIPDGRALVIPSTVRIQHHDWVNDRYYFETCKVVRLCYDAFPFMTPTSSGVRQVVLPDTLQHIESGACAGLKHINIVVPDGLQSIGYCGLIREDIIYQDCGAYYYGGAYYFGNPQNPYVVLLRVDPEADQCIIHPNTKLIHDGAFACTRKIEKLRIPQNVRFIGRQGYSSIKEVEFENPNGWYEVPLNNASGYGSATYGTLGLTHFCGGIKR